MKFANKKKNQKPFLLPLIAALFLNLAASSGWTQEQIDATKLKVPTPEDVFQRGKFPKRPLDPFAQLPRGIKAEELKQMTAPENHAGKQVELTERRPVADLSTTVFAKYAKPGSQLIANFFYRGQFYIARVPENGVKDVYFQLSYFPPIVRGNYMAAHSLMRFEMNENSPIELVMEMPDTAELERLAKLGSTEAFAQLPDENPEKIIKISNAAISAEAQWSTDDPKKEYSLFRGLDLAFVQIVRFVSMEDRMRSLFRFGNPVVQIRLRGLTIKEKSDILFTALEKSESDGLKKIYNTLRYNCTTLLWDVLKQAIGNRDFRWWVPVKLGGFWPTFTKGRLEKSGYNGEEVVPLHLDPSVEQDKINAAKFVQSEPSAQTNWDAMIDQSRAFATEVLNGMGITEESTRDPADPFAGYAGFFKKKVELPPPAAEPQ